MLDFFVWEAEANDAHSVQCGGFTFYFKRVIRQCRMFCWFRRDYDTCCVSYIVFSLIIIVTEIQLFLEFGSYILLSEKNMYGRKW